MKLTDEERSAIVQYRADKAYQALSEAKAVAGLKLWNLAANRLYYACYYASAALLIAKEMEAHTHSGVYRMIGLNFVKENLLDKEDSKLMKRLFMMRQSGDYDDMFDWTEEDVSPIIDSVCCLVDKILGLI